MPLTAAIEPVRMMEPPSLKSGSAFCTVNSVPLTFTSNSLVEMLLSHGICGHEFANPRIGENNVDSALLRFDDFIQPIEIGQFGDIALHVPSR